VNIIDLRRLLGWGGRCGNNEVTCDMAGFGSEGVVSFDW
jgi:hypothetical protein